VIQCAARLALLLSAPALLSAADRWRISFFHDKPRETFDIADFQCPAAGRCIAVGALEHDEKFSPHAVITADSGAHWTSVAISEIPVSLFFLNADTAWMVAEKGIWQSHDGGQNWKKLSPERELQRVYFLDENRGFAVGDEQKILQTTNGGLKWTAVGSLQGLTSQPAENAFSWIFFPSPTHGIAIGEIEPSNASRVPAWLEPKRHHSRWLLLGRTTDAGVSWKFSRLQRDDDLVNVGVVKQALWFFFQPAGAEGQSEIARCDWDKDALVPLLSDSQAIIADSARSGETTFVAAISRQGRLMDVPIPGKLRVFSGPDFDRMAPMDVDYRAVAMRAHFAVTSDGNAFLATDTGMILKLTH